MILTSRTLPDWANKSCRSSSVVANERLPTYNFTDISSVLMRGFPRAGMSLGCGRVCQQFCAAHSSRTKRSLYLINLTRTAYVRIDAVSSGFFRNRFSFLVEIHVFH